MRKKLAAVLLCMCMVLTLLPVSASAAEEYGLWVGGVRVDATTTTINGASTTGTVAWNNSTNTLTLNGATITGAYGFGTEYGYTGTIDKAGIYYKPYPTGSDATLTIELRGNNTIEGQAGQISSYGIYAAGAGVKFTGSGALNVSAAPGNATHRYSWSVAIYAAGSIEVGTGCTITATCSTARGTYAPVKCFGTLTENGTLTQVNNGAASTTPTVTITYADGTTVTAPKVGETLYAKVTNAPENTTLTYLWGYNDGAASRAFSNATNDTYTLGADAVGKKILVQVRDNSAQQGELLCQYVIGTAVVAAANSTTPTDPTTPATGNHYRVFHVDAEKAESPKTADTGVMLYAALSLVSLTGTAWWSKKRK